MKDSHAISITKLLNLSDYNIKPFEICWSKVKMTSSRWITCCHRRTLHPEENHASSAVSRVTISANHLSENYLPNSNGPHKYTTHHHDNGGQTVMLPSSISSDNSVFTQSTSSPMSLSSGFYLGRKSSSLSSNSSATSSCSNPNHDSRQPLMKHSTSTYDLSSPHRFAQPFRYPQRYRDTQDDFDVPSSQENNSLIIKNTITLISPFDYVLINCETNVDTNCAQISPELDVIAVSNDYWLAFYSIRTNKCLGTLQFPDKCIFWTWVRSETVAIITKNDVYHWRLTNTEIDSDSNYIQRRDFPRLIFSMDEDIKDNQIINYCIDPTFGYWCAVSTLFIEDDGEIGGRVQIYSHSYSQSQCIEAHSCTFVSYKFDDSQNKSTLLVAAKREDANIWKLHIIELGPVPNGNQSHRLKTQHLMLHSPPTNSQQDIHPNDKCNTYDDIPTNIVCDNKVGLVYLLSKYGSFYICDIETGVPLYYDLLSNWINGVAFFSLSYDENNNTLLAIARNGQVLVIKVALSYLIEDSANSKVQPKVLERISRRIKESKHHNSHYDEDVASPGQPKSNNCHPQHQRHPVDICPLDFQSTTYDESVHHSTNSNMAFNYIQDPTLNNYRTFGTQLSANSHQSNNYEYVPSEILENTIQFNDDLEEEITRL